MNVKLRFTKTQLSKQNGQMSQPNGNTIEMKSIELISWIPFKKTWSKGYSLGKLRRKKLKRKSDIWRKEKVIF